MTLCGDVENVRPEFAATTRSKMRDWKMEHQKCRAKNARKTNYVCG